MTSPAIDEDNEPTVVGDDGWHQVAVFYEVIVRSFADSNHDGIGALPGLTAKLEYLQWLASTACGGSLALLQRWRASSGFAGSSLDQGDRASSLNATRGSDGGSIGRW